jgi:hypothetical protein
VTSRLKNDSVIGRFHLNATVDSESAETDAMATVQVVDGDGDDVPQSSLSTSSAETADEAS